MQVMIYCLIQDIVKSIVTYRLFSVVFFERTVTLPAKC